MSAAGESSCSPHAAEPIGFLGVGVAFAAPFVGSLDGLDATTVARR